MNRHTLIIGSVFSSCFSLVVPPPGNFAFNAVAMGLIFVALAVRKPEEKK